MSELPSITITKKPVTSQQASDPSHESKPEVAPSHAHGERMSRRDQYIYNHSTARTRNGVVMVEVAVSPHSQRGYERMVISPSNVSVYSNVSMAESLMSAADDLASLSVHGEKLTPQGSPRGSPSHSPNRYPQPPYIMADSRHASPARSHSYSPYRVPVYSRNPSVSPGHSPSRDLSPASSVYMGSPSHSPARSYHSISRRTSDISNYSGDDVSLHNYLAQPLVYQQQGIVYAPQQASYIGSAPMAVAMPLHPRAPGSINGSVSSRDASPNEIMLLDPKQHSPTVSMQTTKVKDMSTQTSNQRETVIKPRSYHIRHKHKGVKKSNRQNKSTNHVTTHASDAKTSSNPIQKEKVQVNAPKNQTGEDKQKRQKAVLVMKTLTTVTPKSQPDSTNMSSEATSFSRESTIHIDIDYDSNSTADDILKSAIIAEIPNTHIRSVLMPGPETYIDPLSQAVSPSSERRPSVSGPIPEISLMCATPDELTPASPGIPIIDGEQESGSNSPIVA